MTGQTTDLLDCCSWSRTVDELVAVDGDVHACMTRRSPSRQLGSHAAVFYLRLVRVRVCPP
jgi:hypothetical protein